MEMFTQLMVTDDASIITEKQRDFKMLHTEILTFGQAAADNFVRFAVKLQEMKQSKLYEEAGFETFEDYTEKACNIKARQAYNYLAIVDKLPEEYVKANAHIGVSKLALIASLSPEQREELEDNVDIEDISSRGLKDEIDKLKQQVKQQQMTIEEKAAVIESKDSVIEDLRKTKVKEDPKLKVELEKAKKEAEAANVELKKAQAAADEAKKALETKQVEIIKDPEQEKEIENLTADLKYAEEQLKAAKEREKLLSNQSVQKFLVQFDNLKAAAKAVNVTLSEMHEEDRFKFSAALKRAYEMLMEEL